MANGNGITAKETVDAIRSSKGFITTVAKRLNCSRQHVYNLIKKYASAKEALDDEREQLKDFAESKLFKMIDSENMTAIIFYLKTQAKDRGYVERQEVTGADGKELEIKIVGGLDLDEI